jgi:hypothetical protein
MLTKKDNKNDAKNGKTAKNPSSAAGSHESHSGCCQPPATTGAHPPAKVQTQTTQSQHETHSDKKGTGKTKITVKYDVGFSNQIFIRGKGAHLSWDKGQPLKNVKPDEWVWETDVSFTSCEFKVLINDRVYENGDNHHLNAGSTLVYSPHFY